MDAINRSDIQALEAAFDATEHDARTLVDGLTEELGTWRADSGSWSVAECLDHLATGNCVYLRAMQPAADRALALRRHRRCYAQPGLIGGWFVRILEPPVNPRFRLKAPPAIRPRVSPPLHDAFAQFLTSQEDVRTFLRKYATSISPGCASATRSSAAFGSAWPRGCTCWRRMSGVTYGKPGACVRGPKTTPCDAGLPPPFADGMTPPTTKHEIGAARARIVGVMRLHLFHVILAIVLAVGVPSAQAVGPRAILIEARNLAYDANYRNDQAGLRSAIAVMAPLTKESATAAYAHYYLSWTYGALWASQFQAKDAAGALDSAHRGLEHARAGLALRERDPEFHAQLAGAVVALMFADRSQFEKLYPELRAARQRAVELGPRNPRAVLVEAGMIFNDPSEGDGAQQRGLSRWQEALRLFEREANETAADTLAPRWGYASTYGGLAGLYLRVSPVQKEDARRAAQTALQMRPDFWYVREVILPQLRD